VAASQAGAAPSLRDRVLRPQLAVPAAFVLTALWLSLQAVQSTSFLWLIDEILYVKYALGYAQLDGLLPSVHGVRHGVPNILYPLVLAPVVAALPMPAAFDAAHVVNAILFASTLFPVYLLARRVGALWGWALLAGLLAVWVPWSSTTLLLMTESIAYPAFAWALLAIVAAVAEPSPRHDALAAAAVLAATLARTQLVFLAAVLAGAIVLEAVASRDPRAWRVRLHGHRALLALGALALVLFGAAQALGADLLASYTTATNKPLLPDDWLPSAARHAARVFVGTALLPGLLFLAWLLRAGARPGGAPERAAAIVLGLSVPLIFYQAGFFAQSFAGGAVQERYVMYAVPVVVVGAVALASDRERPAPRLSLVAAAVLLAMVVGAERYATGTVARGAFPTLMGPAEAFNDVIALPLQRLASGIPGQTGMPAEGVVVVLGALTAASMLAFAPRWRGIAVPAMFAAVLVFGIAQASWIMPRAIAGISQGYPQVLQGVGEQPRDWVDRALPSGAEAAVLAGRLNSPDEQGQWLWTEFWNKRITQGVSRDGLSAYSGWPGSGSTSTPPRGRPSPQGHLDTWWSASTRPRCSWRDASSRGRRPACSCSRPPAACRRARCSREPTSTDARRPPAPCACTSTAPARAGPSSSTSSPTRPSPETRRTRCRTRSPAAAPRGAGRCRRAPCGRSA
jgi:hypothetical protein